MAVLTTPVLNHRFKNVTQCNGQELRKQVPASCAGEDIVRSQLVGLEGAGRESEVCVPASSASQTAPHHLTSVCYSAPLYNTLHCTYRARQDWSCSWICIFLEQVQWLTCESQQVQSNCLRGVCTTHRVALLLSSTA